MGEVGRPSSGRAVDPRAVMGRNEGVVAVVSPDKISHTSATLKDPCTLRLSTSLILPIHPSPGEPRGPAGVLRGEGEVEVEVFRSRTFHSSPRRSSKKSTAIPRLLPPYPRPSQRSATHIPRRMLSCACGMRMSTRAARDVAVSAPKTRRSASVIPFRVVVDFGVRGVDVAEGRGAAETG